MNEMPNLIQNGYFGNNQPMGGYNPYQQPMMSNFMPPPQPMQSNIIPIGSYNYNSTAFNPYGNNQQQQYTFQPVNGGYDPMAQYRAQQQGSYYSPYPQYQQQYINPYQQYSYQNYNGYSPFMSMQAMQQAVNNQITVSKIKCRVQLAALGKEINEDKIDEWCNPNNKVYQVSDEQRQNDAVWKEMVRLHQFCNSPVQYDSPIKQMANFMQLQIKNYHEAFDSHSMCEFFEEDYPRLQREFWIAENIKRNGNRDLSTTYNSREYNELLNMHRSSNPYINELMDNSRYDNNIDDSEIGLAEVFDREMRRRNVLEGKLPTFVSSPEVQEQRRLFTEKLMDQIYRKNASKGGG